MYKLIVVIGLVILVSGCTNLEIGSMGTDNIRDIAESPETYEGQEVTIRGEYGMNLLGDGAISDSEGYFVLVSKDCMKNRAPKMGEIYTFTGTLGKGKFPITGKDMWIIKC